MTLGAIVSRLLEPNICGYFAVMALQPIMLGTQKKWPASFSDGPSFWLLFWRPQGLPNDYVSALQSDRHLSTMENFTGLEVLGHMSSKACPSTAQATILYAPCGREPDEGWPRALKIQGSTQRRSSPTDTRPSPSNCRSIRHDLQEGMAECQVPRGGDQNTGNKLV